MAYPIKTPAPHMCYSAKYGRSTSKGIIIIIVIIVIEMNIIKVALSHFCCRTTVQSDSVSVARQVTVRRW